MGDKNLFNIVYLLSENPATCPKCGARTDIIFDLSHSTIGTQIHECLAENCKKIFATEVDGEFSLSGKFYPEELI